MKVLIGAVVLVMLMICATTNAYANKADTEQEAGIGADGLDRPCTYGPDHDECHDQFLERTHNLPILPPNQYYGACIETELTCDVLTVSIQRG